MKKKIIFVTDAISGGVGRVITILSKGFSNRGFNVDILTFEQNSEDYNLCHCEKLLVLDKQNIVVQKKDMMISKIIMIFARVLGIVRNYILQEESDVSRILRFYARNYSVIRYVKKYFRENRGAIIISFLNAPIFITLLSKQKNNKVILSERNDPARFECNATTMAFIRREYPKCDCMVFQSLDAKKWYDIHSNVNGKVVFNPIKENLPEPFEGKRQKKIVNFCRISDQKNLELLIEAFLKLHVEYPEYELYIYGDAVGNGAEGYLDKIKSIVAEKNMEHCIHLSGGRSDIHEVIKDYAMFVSSSDFEGMSNSMLEAMAIGLPTVCTDCPAGGARAVIQDYENGLLVPVRDVDSLYKAMKELIENSELAERLSQNAVRIREEQSLENIIEKWMEIIHD